MELKWKIYGAFWEFTRPFRTFKTGIKNLWYWRKIIWNNRWYDYDCLLDMIEHQLKYMADEKHKEYAWTKGWDSKVEQMNESLRLLDHFYNQSWKDMSLEYDNEQMWFEEFINSLKVMRNWWD